ncbi:hypothetical protein J3459_006336 [Metarhizium acridum]|nr:hypothetical protein J3459_006336 [Metarhizium acridum]
MSLGIKSIWRTGSRCIGLPGALPIWRCGLHSRGSLLSASFSTTRRQYEAEQEKDKTRDSATLASQALPMTSGIEQSAKARGEVVGGGVESSEKRLHERRLQGSVITNTGCRGQETKLALRTNCSRLSIRGSDQSK